jgi:hypothetical protein
MFELLMSENDSQECTMPTLSSLLQNQRIAETDSFVICIQIHSPIGPQYPQHPSAYYVPRNLLNGVEASLDNPRKYERVQEDYRYAYISFSSQTRVI